MVYCPPTCAIPCSTPSIGLGPCGTGSGYGYGSIGYGGYGYGGGVPASSLGLTSGANVSCISQIPASELVICPAPAVVTVPGPILSASCEPLSVGGYTPCASGPGYGYGEGSYGGSYGGYLGGGYHGGFQGICPPKRYPYKYPC